MGILRMIQIEAEITDPAVIAQVIRLAMAGADPEEARKATAVMTPLVTAIAAPKRAAIPKPAKLEEKPEVANGVTADQAPDAAAPLQVRQRLGPTVSLILKALRQGPKSPSELAGICGITMPAVYSSTGPMKDRGHIESQVDESDGQRKWFITQAGKELLS